MKIIPGLLLTASLLTAPFGGVALAAGSAPAQLHNKSIVIFWAQANTWRRLSDNRNGSSTISMERTIYVSSAGRPFVRQKYKSGKAGGKGDAGPENLSGRFDFNGNTVVNYMGREGLLWHITMTFDPSFSSCTSTINIARDGAHPIATGADGAQYENLSATAGSVSCSVKDGNAVAG